MTTDVYNKTGEKVGSIELSDRLFGRRWSSQLVHQALLAQVANSRQPVAHAKGRSEVAGGGRKPYRQKGTGRARHGSTRSPIWKGGGVTHGPLSTRDFSVRINKKMKQGAIFSLLSKKLKDGNVRVIDSIQFEAPKTKVTFSFLSDFIGKVEGKEKKTIKISALLIPSSENREIYRTARNIEKVKALDPRALNVYDLLKYKHIFLDKSAIETIEKTYESIK